VKPDKTPPNWAQRRATHILSERAFCGHCSGSIVSVEKNYLACGNARKLKACSQNKSIRRPTLDNIVIDLLKNKLMRPAAVSVFITTYNNEIKSQRSLVQNAKNPPKGGLNHDVLASSTKMVAGVGLNLGRTKSW
jgi:hypothetical protein